MSRYAIRYLLGAVLALAASAAAAQTCSGAPNAAAAASEKFRLIFEQCDVLSDPVTVRRAGQLDLYDRRSASVGITMTPVEVDEPPAKPAATPAPAHAAPRTPLAPPTRDAQRVIALAPTLTSTARAYDLDPLLLHAIAHVESRHNAAAVSPVGARGVMQVMPATAKRFGVQDDRALFDADTNLRASAALLQTLFKRYGDDTRLVLAAYNAGEGAVDKYGRNVPPYPETQGYVRDVLAAYRRLSAEFAVGADGNLIARK